MAEELQLSGSLRLVDTDAGIDTTFLRINRLAVARTTRLMAAGTQTIATGATPTVLDIGTVTTEGWAVFLNLDSSNFIQVGFDVSATFRPALKISAGSFAICEIEPTQTWEALADTSSAPLQFAIFERNA